MNSAATVGHGQHGDHGVHGEHGEHVEHIHPPSFYIKTWAILIVLLVISILGPMLEIRAVTIMTAFGIAVVKAYIVCARFMHLDIERRYVVYFLSVSLGFMGLFFFAIAPDILKHHGTNWVNEGAIAEIERHGGKDEGGDVHEDKGHGGEHGAAGATAEHGATDGPAESAELAARRAEAAKKLENVQTGMKAVVDELKAAAPATPAPATPPTTTETPPTPAPEAPKAPEAPPAPTPTPAPQH